MKKIIGLLISLQFFVTTVSIAAEDQRTVLITGANSGIGLEFVRQYADRGWRVIATCRNPDGAEDLQALAADNTDIVIERLDLVGKPQRVGFSREVERAQTSKETAERLKDRSQRKNVEGT